MPGGSKKGGGLEVGSAYKMKGSPHNQGQQKEHQLTRKKHGLLTKRFLEKMRIIKKT